MHRTLAGAATLAAAGLAATPAVAGVIERRPVVQDGSLIYRDDFEFDDGFKVIEFMTPSGLELAFERTTGDQPLRTLDPDCTAETENLVRCRGLADTRVLELNLIAGDDVADASGVRSFAVEGYSGSGNAELTGGARDDTLGSDNGSDTLRGGPGDDRLTAGDDSATSASDKDTVDGGPGHDKIRTGDQADTVLGRDGERDDVDCGPGVDVVIADADDDLRDCEVIEYPPREADPQPQPQPQPPAPGRPAPPPGEPAGPAGPATPPAEARRAGALRRVVRLPKGARCLPGRGLRARVRPVEGFIPARVRVIVGGRTSVRRRGPRATIRVRPAAGRRTTVRFVVTGRDGRRVRVTRRLRNCSR